MRGQVDDASTSRDQGAVLSAVPETRRRVGAASGRVARDRVKIVEHGVVWRLGDSTSPDRGSRASRGTPRGVGHLTCASRRSSRFVLPFTNSYSDGVLARFAEDWKEAAVTARTPDTARDIPEATVARLPVYLRALTGLAEDGTTTCSSEELAAAAGVNSAKLRKDLSYLGSYGTRGVGYDVEYLRYQIAREIGVTQDWPVVIVGIGNLGHALANYSGFRSRGFRVVALLDADPTRQDEVVAGLDVAPSTTSSRSSPSTRSRSA